MTRGAGRERTGERDGEGRSEMEGEEKSNLLSLILCETLPWQRGGETALISGSDAEKGHSISAPPAGVVLTGAAQTRLIMLSVSTPDARGWEDGSSGEIALMRRCALTQFPLLAFFSFQGADSCATRERDKQDDTQSKIIKHKCMALRRIMLSTKFWFRKSFISAMTGIHRKGSQHPLCDFSISVLQTGSWKEPRQRHSPSFYCHRLNPEPFFSWFKEPGCISPDMRRSTHCHSLLRRTLTTALAARRFMVIDSMW